MAKFDNPATGYALLGLKADGSPAFYDVGVIATAGVPVPVANGGTGAVTAQAACTALGLKGDVTPVGTAKHFYHLPGVRLIGTVDTLAIADANTYYFPFEVRHTQLVVDTCLYEITVAGGAGKLYRIAIFNADDNWQVGAKVCETAEQPLDAVAAVHEVALAGTLTPGRYFIALKGNAAATFRTAFGIGPMSVVADTFGATGMITRVSKGEAYGVWADPGTDWDTATEAAASWEYPIFLHFTT